MKLMYKIKIMVAVLLCAGLFTGCGEKDYSKDLSNDIPHYVYVSSSLDTLISATDLVYDGKNSATCVFQLRYGVTNDKTATVDAIIEPDFDLVKIYNEAKSQSLLALPAKHLVFTDKTANIPAGSNQTSISFELIELKDLPHGEYILPVAVKSVKASNGFPLFAEKSIAYYRITKGDRPLSYARYTFTGPDFRAADVPGGLPLEFVGNPISEIVAPVEAPEEVPRIGGRGAVFVSQFNSIKVPSIKKTATRTNPMTTYTILLDVYPMTTDDGYAGTLQINEKNQGDADIYILDNGKIGGGDYSAAGAVKFNQWNRIVLVVDIDNTLAEHYVNGVFVFNNKNRAGNKNEMTINNNFWLFADGYGHAYEGDACCAGFAIWDRALTAAEIASLGGPENPLQLEEK